ncbi:MAG: HD domain-containing protein [Lachnospiraceae bacterium]|nr:HD domain-containing protein [Lachnospiraceae bacterium]
MNRVNNILKNELFRVCLEKIKNYEQERIFCKHDICHFIDVCRIAENLWLEARIQMLEENANASNRIMRNKNTKELIYAAGLLHDIGRWQEYENGTPHEIASSHIAPSILQQCGFDQEEIETINLAILNHRNKEIMNENNLSGWMYLADKKSRACFACESEALCNWSKEKKNLKLM